MFFCNYDITLGNLNYRMIVYIQEWKTIICLQIGLKDLQCIWCYKSVSIMFNLCLESSAPLDWKIFLHPYCLVLFSRPLPLDSQSNRSYAIFSTLVASLFLAQGTFYNKPLCHVQGMLKTAYIKTNANYYDAIQDYFCSVYK